MKMNLKHKDIVLQCAQRYESFYLYDESSISNSIEQLKTHFPQVDFLYSMKCNSNPRVLQCVFNHGLGADAASSEEVRLAKTAGLPEHRIYYSAPGKSDEDIRKTIFSSTLIADSKARLSASVQWLKKWEQQRVSASGSIQTFHLRRQAEIRPNSA